MVVAVVEGTLVDAGSARRPFRKPLVRMLPLRLPRVAGVNDAEAAAAAGREGESTYPAFRPSASISARDLTGV